MSKEENDYFSPQEMEAAQNDLTNVLLLEQFYNTTHNEVYPIALDLINKGKFIVTDSTLEDASYHKKCLEQGIVSCKIFIVAYDGGKFTPAMKAFEATSAGRREEFAHMWGVFEQALDIVKDGFLRYKLWKSERDVLMKISKYGSNDTLKKLYSDSVDFETMQHNCEFILDAAWDLEFNLSKDKVLDNYVKQLKKILYDIRGKEEVEDLLNATWREDVRAAFSALYDERDPKKAMRLYEKAAQAGSGEAMYELGQLYRNFWRPCILSGHPVAKDNFKAIEWYRKAADANYATAMDALGGCYESGDCYVSKDINEAIHWYKKAAALGCSKSMRTLARIYQEGVSVSQNTSEAQRWRNMSTFNGYREGIRQLKAILNSDTSDKSAVTAPWMNSDKSATTAPWMNSTKSAEPVKVVETKTPATIENTSKKSSEEKKYIKTPRDSETAIGMAFWVAMVVYAVTSADFFTSLVIGAIVGGITYIVYP